MASLSADIFSQINYWAVLVSGLVIFFLGGLWYSPALFEEVWMNANGYTAEQVQQLPGSLGVTGFSAAFLAYVIIAIVFAALITALGIHSAWGGALLGLLLWLGFTASTALGVNLFSLQPLAVWLINSGFHLAALVISGVILAVWR